LFGQFDESKEKGFGVGLFLIKKIVDRNNGKISFDSKLGEGTTVKVIFNLTKKTD
jgi:signal transduction histidine kinase